MNRATNYLFYTNQIPSKPQGATIDEIHAKWNGDYHLLEMHHSYIQWLFPLYEGPGVNYAASALTKKEAKDMREDEEIGQRVALSYELMLDFYGMQLDRKTGQVSRASNWTKRYLNLTQNTHNFLRISRILASLGHLGFWRWKVAWINFLETEIYEGKAPLKRCAGSFERFWVALRDVENPDPEEFEDNVWYKKRYLSKVNDEESERMDEQEDTGEDSVEERTSEEVQSVSVVEVTEFDPAGPIRVTIKRQTESRESLSPQLKQEEKRQRVQDQEEISGVPQN